MTWRGLGSTEWQNRNSPAAWRSSPAPAAASAAPWRWSWPPAAAPSWSMCGSNRAEAEGVVKEIEGKGGKAMAAIADVTDAPAVEAMAQGGARRNSAASTISSTTPRCVRRRPSST